MEKDKIEKTTSGISLGQADVLAAIYKKQKENPKSIVTLDDLHKMTGLEKGNISKIISTIRKLYKENEVIKNTRSQEFQGYGLNGDYIVTSALTARIFLELRDETVLNSIPLEAFKKEILNADFFKKAGGTEQIFDTRLQWALHPAIGYINRLKTIEGNISANQRINDESFYLEKIAFKSAKGSTK